MAVAEAMAIASLRRASVTASARRGKKKRRELRLRSEKQSRDPLTRQDDRTWADKRTAVCFRTRLEVVRNSIVAGTTTEATEFAVSSCTRAAMAMRTISKLRKNARAFATMPLVFAI